jgi:RNA polymerase sigma-70 factor (ECF subfamily)
MTDRTALVRDIESFRRELVAHCYRMSGSYEEAQDLVQETFLRAWRAADTFEGRASTRTWLYRIATNVCLSALRNGRRRALPSGLVGDDDAWLQPIPTNEAPDPADAVAARSHLRLALIAGLQLLSPRQRAVLLLRDVLSFDGNETSAMLDMSVPAVKSALQRARATLQAHTVAADEIVEPDDPTARALLDGYMKAFETADVAMIADLLHADATIEVAPTGTTVSGKACCLPYLADEVLRAPGEYRMVATSANSQPAAIAYRKTEAGRHRAFGIAVLTVVSHHIRTISVFAEPRLVEVFGYPPGLEDENRRGDE